MTTQPNPADDPLETLLRKPSAPIADDGFTARVLTALPPPMVKPRLFPSRRVVMCSLGALAGVVCAVAQSGAAIVNDFQSFGLMLGSSFTALAQSVDDLRTPAITAAIIIGSLAVAYFREIVAKIQQL